MVVLEEELARAHRAVVLGLQQGIVGRQITREFNNNKEIIDGRPSLTMKHL